VTSQLHAEGSGVSAQQQEMDKALEIMKDSGIDPETINQIKGMMQGLGEMAAEQATAKLEKEKEEFEEATADNGTAQVEVEGKRYELKVIKCEIKDKYRGDFSIHARQAPGNDDAELWVNGGGERSQSTVRFSESKQHYDSDHTKFQFNGEVLEWEGALSGGDGQVPVTVHLTCGAEAVDYAKPSKPRPKTPVNILTLQMGDETYEFEAGHCSTTEYRTGNLMVEFEATATGTFRSRPAIVLLSRSRAVAEYGSEYFQNLDLYLGELSADQRSLSPMEVGRQIQRIGQEYTIKEQAAIQEKYKEMFNSVPPEEISEVLEAQSKEMDRVREEVDAVRYPAATSKGTITVNGHDVHYGGSKMHTNDASRTPEFQNLSAVPEVWVTCGE